VYCNDAPDYIQVDSTLALFADDSKLYRTLEHPTSSSLLQVDLNNVQRWSIDMKMEFNPNKCKAMHISRKKKLENETLYNLNGQPIEKVMHIRDLGVTVSSDLSWSRHIEVTASKANKTLGLKRICRNMRDYATRRLLYCTLVRPQLEHASNVWSPYTIKHKSFIENIQRRATKFILNYPSEMSYTERLIKTNLLPLEFRREISDLLLVFISKTGLISMDVNNFYAPSNQAINHDAITRRKQFQLPD
jgi:hypothetical protein